MNHVFPVRHGISCVFEMCFHVLFHTGSLSVSHVFTTCFLSDTSCSALPVCHVLTTCSLLPAELGGRGQRQRHEHRHRLQRLDAVRAVRGAAGVIGVDLDQLAGPSRSAGAQTARQTSSIAPPHIHHTRSAPPYLPAGFPSGLENLEK